MGPGEFAIVNITLEAFSIVLVAALIVSMGWKPTVYRRKMLIAAMWLDFVATSADLMSWVFDGRPGLLARVIVEASNPISCVFTILACMAIVGYVYIDGFGEPRAKPQVDPVVVSLWAINAINLIIVFTNPFTHLYYSITPANEFIWGPLSWIYDLLLCVQWMLMLPALMRLNARRETRMMVRLFMCGLLMLVATPIDIVLKDVLLLYPACAIMLVVLALGVQAGLEEDLAQAAADAAESRVRLLSGQIQPHFVFNSLAAIRELVAVDQDLAGRAIMDFSDYLRSHLDVMSDARLVPFMQEIDHVRHYVSLEQADADRPLEVIYHLEADDFMLPPLVVQPLVENAIRHGLRTRETGGMVEVSSRRIPGGIEVSVIDDGRGLSSATEQQEQRSKVGLENVRERLERLCKGSLTVSYGEYGTVATIVLPEGEGV